MRGGTSRTRTAIRYPTYFDATIVGFEIGRVRRYEIVLSSISSRINAVALTSVTKITTTCRRSGTRRAWNNRMLNVATRAIASPDVRISGTAARRDVAITRRVVSR